MHGLGFGAGHWNALRVYHARDVGLPPRTPDRFGLRGDGLFRAPEHLAGLGALALHGLARAASGVENDLVESYTLKVGADGRTYVEVGHRGTRLLSHSMYNKSTAFTREERRLFDLEGLLPDAVSTMAQQASRVYANIARKSDSLEKYIGLAALQDRNETLFYRVLADHLEEFLPIVYTPTVGRACQDYSRIFRRARGLWITPQHRGRIDEVLANAPFADVRLVVVTDNERILGLGDQGAGGMGIPIGKLALYTAIAGIHPAQTLPVSLDVGTDNPALLEDDLYLGWRQPRLRGERYDALVDEFVKALRQRFPKAVLQWEDFKQGNASGLLERYRRILPSFNDDIQGTGAVALTAILASAKLTGIPIEKQTTVILGGGAAGVGIAQQIRSASARAGLKGDALTMSVAIVDLEGLLVASPNDPPDFRHSVRWDEALAGRRGLGEKKRRDLLAVVQALHPTVLIGASGAPGAFTEPVLREMAAHVERPVVLPLSNPNTLSEAEPKDVIAWTAGRALVATGSPFPPVNFGSETRRIGLANNVFVFPGLGLGALVSGASEISDSMILAAAERLAHEVRTQDLAGGSLFPPIGGARRITARIAEAVVREARDSGLGRPMKDDEIAGAVEAAMWEPDYLPMEPA